MVSWMDGPVGAGSGRPLWWGRIIRCRCNYLRKEGLVHTVGLGHGRKG